MTLVTFAQLFSIPIQSPSDKWDRTFHPVTGEGGQVGAHLPLRVTDTLKVTGLAPEEKRPSPNCSPQVHTLKPDSIKMW